MTRSCLLFALLAVVSFPATLLAGQTQPHVLVIIADDMGWGDLSRHGNTNLATPRLDGLAAAGARFERFYVQPVCAPTRAEFLTGRYAPRDGVTGVTQGRERLDLGVPTIAAAFQSAGYATGLFGKWHNGAQAPYHPLTRGFDEFYGFCCGHWGLDFDPPLDHNGRIVEGRGYLADDLTDRAIEFISASRSEPFFVVVAYNTPHSPMQVPDRWWRPHADQQLTLRGTQAAAENVPHTRAALAMVENLDWNVGRLLDALTKRGYRDDTIVVFFSDNGPNGHRFNEGLRGIKGSVDEGGVRSPLFVDWPGRITAGWTIAPSAAAIDLLPTLADLAGIDVHQSESLDGITLAPLLRGTATDLPPRSLFTHWNERTAVRAGEFVLNANDRLYDLAADPCQLHDVADAHEETASRLRAGRRAWLADVFAGGDRGRPFPVGHPGLPTTYLPAADGQPHGGVQRSSRHPNNSFFTDWTTVDGFVSWDVEVLRAGRYRVEAYATRPVDAEAPTLELRFANQSLRATVVDGYDPPEISTRHNRVPAEESPVKRFRAVELGEIELPAGRGELVLRAVEAPGGAVIDLSQLALTYLP